MKINSDHAKRKENRCIESMLYVTLGWGHVSTER